MDNEPVILHDRMPVNQLKQDWPALWEFMETRNAASITGKDTVHFCGIVCPSGHEPAFFLPRGTGKLNSLLNSRLTMQALARYGRDVESRTGSSPTEGGQASQAALIHEISTDYLQNGLYSQRIRIRNVATGKPDWKRTLARRIPMLAANRVPIYPDFDTTVFLDAHENILTLIQAETVREIVDRHGWWTGMDRSRITKLVDVRYPPIDRNLFAASIRRFMQFLYDDRSLALARLLMAYWDDDSTTIDGSFICGVPDFSAVWEHMLRSLVKDTSKYWNSKLPLPGYIYRDGRHIPRKKGGVMDIVIEHDESITVADAKYYAALSSETAPGFSDILKQAFYASSLQEANHDRPVESCFVFPSGDGSPPLREAVFFEREKLGLPVWLKPASCLYVDMEKVMKEYTSRRSYDWLRISNS